MEKVLKERDAYGATFYEIGEHAPITGIENGIQVFRESDADVIVSVGGGSPIDASKVIIHTIQKESRGAFYKQIAIPTTLSAAEYTVSCLCRHNASRILVGVLSVCCRLYKCTRTEGWGHCAGASTIRHHSRR